MYREHEGRDGGTDKSEFAVERVGTNFSQVARTWHRLCISNDEGGKTVKEMFRDILDVSTAAGTIK